MPKQKLPNPRDVPIRTLKVTSFGSPISLPPISVSIEEIQADITEFSMTNADAHIDVPSAQSISVTSKVRKEYNRKRKKEQERERERERE